MTRRIPVFLMVLLFALFSCKKEEADLLNTSIRYDPGRDTEALSKSLQMRGHYYADSMLPAKTDTGVILFNMVAPQDTIEAGEETSIYIPFTIPDQGFFKLCATNLQVAGASGFWRVNAVNDTGSSDYSVELAIPSIIRQGNIRLRMNAELCFSLGNQSRRVVTNTVEVLLTVRPALSCGDTLMGTTGLTLAKFYMGEKKGKVKMLLSTGRVGDRVDIRFGGRYILSTCPGQGLRPSQFPRCNSPAECFVITGDRKFVEYSFDYDPAISRFIELYAMGFCGQAQTVWIVRMGCPQ